MLTTHLLGGELCGIVEKSCEVMSETLLGLLLNVCRVIVLSVHTLHGVLIHVLFVNVT